MPRRQSINIPGFRHKNPIPNASRVGDTLMTSVILGINSETGDVPETMEGQCALVFDHIRAIMDAAGGTPDDIVKVTVWLKDPSDRDAVNAKWTKMFPDPSSRPARHTFPDPQDWPYLVSCDFTAILDT